MKRFTSALVVLLLLIPAVGYTQTSSNTLPANPSLVGEWELVEFMYFTTDDSYSLRSRMSGNILVKPDGTFEGSYMLEFLQAMFKGREEPTDLKGTYHLNDQTGIVEIRASSNVLSVWKYSLNYQNGEWRLVLENSLLDSFGNKSLPSPSPEERAFVEKVMVRITLQRKN